MTAKIQKNHLTKNKYSRPAKPLKNVKGVVIHWVANPMTSAKANRDFFESRKGGKKSFGSAHFIIDLDGDVIECIPENEMAYHVGAYKYSTDRLGKYPNNCTLGIELTHPDWSGKFNPAVYGSAVYFTAYLLRKYDLTVRDLYRHYDVTGKKCPRYFVDNDAEWEKFKNNVAGLFIDWKNQIGSVVGC